MADSFHFNPRKHISDWLNRLAFIVPKAMEMTDLAAKIDQMTDLLANKVPHNLFDADSLEFCARRFKFWPSYADLWARLQTWQRERPKELKALPLPDGVAVDRSLPSDDQSRIEQWWRRRPDRVGKIDFANALDLLRKHPASFSAICLSDGEAEKIALRRGWLDTTSQIKLREEWAGIDAADVRAKIAEARKTWDMGLRWAAPAQLSLLRTAVAKYAPQHLHLIPARLEVGERQRTPAQQVEALVDNPPPAAPPERGPSVVDQRALLAQLRTNTALPNRAERIAELLVQWRGHPGFEPLASDPPVYPTPPAAAPPPANDRPTATEDTPELWTPSWMTDAAD